MNPSPFNVQSRAEGGVWIVAVSGELDLNTAPQLDDALSEALASEGSALVIDLSECEFIDSTGIALIVRAWQKLNHDEGGKRSGRFALCGINDQVQRLLDITGLEASIPTHDTREEAIGELRA